jgi:uncharacterized membrane protein
MSDRQLVQASAVLALVGASIAAYLTYARYSKSAIACPTSGCETVQSSSYAVVAGVPVALLGLVAYLVILVGLALPRDLGRSVVFAHVRGGVAVQPVPPRRAGFRDQRLLCLVRGE